LKFLIEKRKGEKGRLKYKKERFEDKFEKEKT